MTTAGEAPLRVLMVHGSMQDPDVFAHKVPPPHAGPHLDIAVMLQCGLFFLLSPHQLDRLVTKGANTFTPTFAKGCVALPLQDGQQVGRARR